MLIAYGKKFVIRASKASDLQVFGVFPYMGYTVKYKRSDLNAFITYL